MDALWKLLASKLMSHETEYSTGKPVKSLKMKFDNLGDMVDQIVEAIK